MGFERQFQTAAALFFLILTWITHSEAILADTIGVVADDGKSWADVSVGRQDILQRVKYGGGTGESSDPYLICTPEQMNAIGLNEDDWDKHFVLAADIDLSAYTGTEFNIIGYWRDDPNDRRPFTGVFDGHDHTISNFRYHCDRGDGVGLFGYVRDPHAEIRNLGLIDPNVIVGTPDDEEDVTDQGSLVGRIDEGVITNCYAKGAVVDGEDNLGGLIGRSRGRITNCYAGAEVFGDGNTGGLVGFNLGVLVCSCAPGGSTQGDYAVGGLVGSNMGTIAYCYSVCTIEGWWAVGGLAGYNSGTISECYAAGSVSDVEPVDGDALRDRNFGGLVGDGRQGAIIASFWDVETSGQENSAGGEGKTTAEMQNPSTFMNAGWDFLGEPDGPHDIWTQPMDGGYPILSWQFPAGFGLPTFSGGTGEPENPFLISTATQLNSIGHNPRLMDAAFALTDDIDLRDVEFYVIGSETFPFCGLFDGRDHAISNFTCHSIGDGPAGLFVHIDGMNVVIHNLSLVDPYMDAGTGDNVGALVGSLEEGVLANCHVLGGSVAGGVCVGGLVGYSGSTVTNCSSSTEVVGDLIVGGLAGTNRGVLTHCQSSAGVVGGDEVGGLIGRNDNSTIVDGYANGVLTGDWYVGGLVGRNDNSTITNSHSDGALIGDWHVGGLVGENRESTITKSCSTARVSGNWYVGGLAGWNHRGEIANSHASGMVTGHSLVGGLVGSNGSTAAAEPSTIIACYAVGSVAGTTHVGGLAGRSPDGDILHCFWDTETAGQTVSAGGEGKTTAEMRAVGTFLDAGWDFVDETANGTDEIWWILGGKDYPRLWWE